MAHRAEGVVTLVVGEEEDDVRACHSFIGFIGFGGDVGGVEAQRWDQEH
jgi:hypothetical protein